MAYIHGNISAGTTKATVGEVVFSNSNGVSFGVNGQTVTATVQTNYLTTAMASNRGSDFVQAAAAFNGTNASGTIASNNISVSVLAQSNQSAIKGFGVSNTGQTAGNTGLSTGIDWVLAGSNSITLSQSTAVGGPNTIWVQHPAWITTAMLSNAATISNINVSGGTTSSNLSNFKLIDSNGVSWSLDTGSKIYATVKTDYLTTADLSQNSSKYMQAWELTGNTAGTTSSLQGTKIYFEGGNSITVSGNSNTVKFSVGNYITTAMLSNAATISNINVSGGTTSSNLSAIKFIDSQGISWSLDTGSKVYGTVKTNYAGTSTGFAGANISGSITNNTDGINLSLSVAAPGAAAENNWVNLLGANTSGNTSASGSTIGYSGLNITLSGTNNSQVVISAPATSSLVGTGGISISTTGSTISVSYVYPTYLSFINRQLGASGSTQWTNNQIWVAPFRLGGGYLSASTFQIMQSLSGTFTSAATAQFGQTLKWCLYSGHSTNTTRFDSMTSDSFTMQMWNSGTSSASYAYSGATSSSAGTNVLTLAAGVRMHPIVMNSLITPGLYALALMASTSSANYSGLFSRYAMIMDNPMPLALGYSFGSATATSIGYVDGGTYGTTTTGFPSSFGFSDIKQHSNLMPFIKIGAI